MEIRRIGLAVLLALIFGWTVDVLAATPAEMATHRQEILDAMLTDEYDPLQIAGMRRICAGGREPAKVEEDRRDGAYFTPDAADSCVVALARTARDRQLSGLYRVLVSELGGNSGGYEQLPRAIGATVMNGISKVAIGNGKVAVVTPALAFDAGFTVAYLEGGANKATANTQQLRAATEACLGQRLDAGTCFSVGYVQGTRAFSARTAAAR